MTKKTEIPDCLGAPDEISKPDWRLPAGAWDTHFHPLGPQSRFPFSADRNYTPPDAPLEECLRMHETVGIERGWAVHANTYGFNNAIDLDAVARSGGRYLAVVRLDETTTRSGCEALHEAGARGVRFAFNPDHGGALDERAFDHVMRCIEGLGWFVELHFTGAAIPELRSWLEGITAPVVIDHMGFIDVRLGLQQEPFEIIQALAARENFWIKITGADRLTSVGYPYFDVAPFVQRLVSIAPDRLLWGSDWPHLGIFDTGRMPDVGKLLNALALMIPDEGQREAILVQNPLRLTGARGRQPASPDHDGNNRR